MTLVTQAVIFAAQAHDGAARKGSEIPYIVHPMEVVAIASTMTDDPQVLAAAALHDVMEDCGVTFDALSERFGVRVAGLVCEESQRACGDPCLTWNARKLSAVKHICGGCRATKIIALSDKLSNMRAISRDFARDGEAMFLKFHQHDKRRHAWYYRSCAAGLRDELGETDAWRELDTLVEEAWKVPGVIGSRMTGAGFGGCTISIVRDEAIEEFIKQVGEAYEKKIGYAADFYVVEIGDGPCKLK